MDTFQKLLYNLKTTGNSNPNGINIKIFKIIFLHSAIEKLYQASLYVENKCRFRLFV